LRGIVIAMVRLSDQMREQIRKARVRAEGQGIEALAAHGTDARTKVTDLAPPTEIARRRRYLEQTEPGIAGVLFERVLGGNELQSVNYLERGARVARAVCRLSIRNRGGRPIGYGTGFLVAPGLLLTNNHVFPDAGFAGASFAEFDYALDPLGLPRAVSIVELEPQRFFATSEQLDFSLVATRSTTRDGLPLDTFGWLPLIAQTGKVLEGEWLTIIQHPDGDPKMVCVRENRLLKRDDDVLWYSTDTMGGSSGSPVFNNDWQVVALHHSGVPDTDANGNWLTWQGEPFVEGQHGEADIKWLANEGIRISRIVQTLRDQHGANPELSLLLAERSPETAPAPLPVQIASRPLSQGDRQMSQFPRRVTVTLESDPTGQFRVVGQGLAAGGSESRALEDRQSRSGARCLEPDLPPFDSDYAGRKGFQADFLVPADAIAAGKSPLGVDLPTLGPLLREAAPLIASGKQRPSALNDCLLTYHGYSIVMHAKRRLAIYSAANIDWLRPWGCLKSRARDWITDPRISLKHQIDNRFYKKTAEHDNKFDRGHLTRNEDMEWGESIQDALRRTMDTFHYTNAVPQHETFNQDKTWDDGDGRALWQGLEFHILEDSINRKDFRASVFTGPVLHPDDPEWVRLPDFQYPERFWKVAVAQTTQGQLFATAFLLDQSDIIAAEGLERTDEPFEPFAFQVTVAEIERLTGLTFTGSENGVAVNLRDRDPLARANARRPRRVRRGGGRQESTGLRGATVPEGYALLSGRADLTLPDDDTLFD
jgi:endonuclease G